MKTAVAIAALVLALVTAIGMLGGALVVTVVLPDEGERPAASRTGKARRQPRTDQSNLALGRSIYSRYCARCHGNNARGYIGPSLVELRTSPAVIETIVQQGPGLMPAFGNVLPPEQIEAVAAYVSLLGSETGTAAADGAQPSPAAIMPQPAPVQWGPMCPMMRPAWQGSQP